MTPPLRSYDDDLVDLASQRPPLIDAESGNFTGITLTRWLGSGGMAAVLLGDLDPAQRSTELSPLCPPRVAIKFAKPSIERDLAKLNLRADDLFRKELTALGRVMERNPPTEFVLGIYGHGNASVEIGPGVVRVLPWLALEFVDSGMAGATLTDRVRRTPEGVDPVRALKLVRGILEGVAVLHEERVIHRDLKPDNVFVAGPLDDETPKIADCGIARVGGVGAGTVAAVTFEYSAPEQVLSIFNPTASNPLIGPWTDLHALAAVVWFLLAGEDWCTSSNDPSWHQGRRRPLQVGARLHQGFRNASSLLDAIDAVLQRAASHRLPDEAWAADGALSYEPLARGRYGASMFAGAVRYSTVAQLSSALLPLLTECAERWTSQAIQQNLQPSVFRRTQMLNDLPRAQGEPFASVHASPPRTISGTNTSMSDPGFPPTTAGNVVFQPDGKVLARFGDRLLYFVGERAHRVPIPDEIAPFVPATKWLIRGPLGGFALIGAHHVILLRGGQFSHMTLPGGTDLAATPASAVSAATLDGTAATLDATTRAPASAEARAITTVHASADIVAAIGDGRVFGLITSDEDDEQLFWRSTDGVTWASPIALPVTGEIHALAYGPYGYLMAGGSTGKKGTQARALWLGLDDQASMPTAGLKDNPPLFVAVCGATRDAWAAGNGCVLRFDRAGVTREPLPIDSTPVAMALDPIGAPWLVTEHAVLRRHEGTPAAPTASWEVYYPRDPQLPRLVGIGFTTDGARLLDERGGGAHVVPRDVARWTSVDTSMLVR